MRWVLETQNFGGMDCKNHLVQLHIKPFFKSYGLFFLFISNSLTSVNVTVFLYITILIMNYYN